MIFPTVILVVALFLAICQQTSATPEWLRKKTFLEKNSHLYNRPKVSQDRNEKFFVQKLDHFDRSVNTTFLQRYFINETFWSGTANAPVFMCVGGEGPPLDRTVLTNSVHCTDMVELAPKHGALMVALEHRYYGPSNPFDDYSTEHMKWLNTEQALGDIATFVSMINEQYKLQPTNRWVTWGGSYPGMVAGLSRLRYPHLIYASVASSAPLQPVVDMVGYNDVVAQSLAVQSVGGSQACADAVRDGHAAIGEKLKTMTGRRDLEKQFNVCKPMALEDEKNREQFAGDGIVYFPIQSNDPSCTTDYCDISRICTLMTDESKGEPIDRLAILASAQTGGICTNPDYEAMITFWSNEKNPERTWLQQTCNEWGFYQTCNTDSNCPYTRGLHTIEVDLDICNRAFNTSPVQVYANIANTQAIYGGANIQSSRTLFTSGEVDPWRANSVIVAPNVHQVTYWVPGASHHFWTHESLSTDSAEVNAARQFIWTTVSDWLAQ